LFPELLLHLPSGVFTATSLLLLAYLGPTMWYLWMDLGTGNANFFYAITLLWAAWQVNISRKLNSVNLRKAVRVLALANNVMEGGECSWPCRCA